VEIGTGIDENAELETSMNLRLTWKAAILVALGASLGVRLVSAAEPSIKECLASSEASLKLANDYKLRAERAQLLVCSAASCPAEIRKECLKRVDEVNIAIPSVVFDVRDPDGNDLTAVKIMMDDEVLAERIRGVALSVDPGEHLFRFSTAGQAMLEKRLLIRESQKDRHEVIQFPGQKKAAEDQTSEAAATERSPALEPKRAAGNNQPTSGLEDESSSKPSVPSSRGVSNLVMLGIQQDFLYHSSATNACSPSSKYECFQGSGERVLVEDSNTVHTQNLSPGFTGATLRLLAGYDRFVLPQLSLGVRLGVVISGKAKQSPGDSAVFVPHLEARVAYFLVGKPLMTPFSPYVVLSGGAAETDANVQLRYQDPSHGCSDCRLNAWKRAGFEFVSAGLGLVAAVAGNTGPLLEARYVQYFGKSGSSIAGQLGYAVGF
jgi:hypothetical protein